jgi:hypothetical protein
MFHTLIGAMVEEGMDPGKEVVFEGSVGEAFDKGWKYVQLVLEWMKWQNAENVGILAREENEQRRRSGISMLPHVARPPVPGQVVYLHDLGSLAYNLDLPEGWEAAVAVDFTKSPLQARIGHYKSVMDWIRKRGYQDDISYDKSVDAMFSTAVDLTVTRSSGNGINLTKPVTYLAPFVHYTALEEAVGGSRRGGDVYAFLMSTDWETVLRAVPDSVDLPSGKFSYSDIKNLAASMLGEGSLSDSVRGYIVPVQKTLGYGIVSPSYWANSSDYERMKEVYRDLIRNYATDVQPSWLGLEPILGISKVDAWGEVKSLGDYSFVKADRMFTIIPFFVGYINAIVLTYPTWYLSVIMLHTRADQDPHSGFKSDLNKQYDSKGTYRIVESDFPKLIKYIHATLGLAVLRRMLLSLLFYIERGGHKIKKATHHAYLKIYQEELARALKRANSFAEAAEEYLGKHDGEDEEVKTFELAKTDYVKEIYRHYEE